jgi:DNA polymerase III subunit beta
VAAAVPRERIGGAQVNLEVPRDTLAAAVSWTSRALAARPQVPVLAQLRLEATAADELRVSAFDYDTAATAVIKADVTEPGTWLLPGRLLADICGSLPRAEVSIGAGPDGRILVASGAARFALSSATADDYPQLPAMPDAAGTVGSALLAEALGQVTVAASRDDTLPALACVRVEVDGPLLTLFCTDRYRLAVRTLTWEPAPRGAGQCSILLAARRLAEIVQPMTASARVTLALPVDGGGMAGFAADGQSALQRLMPGELPDYRAILPGPPSSVVVVPRQAMTEAVKRVALVAEKSTPVRLEFAGDSVRIEAGSQDDARATEAVEVSGGGGAVTAAFNPAYLTDALRAVGTDEVRVSFTEPGKPALFTADGSGDEPAYRHLLMPNRGQG